MHKVNEKTFAIIKPEACRLGFADVILSDIFKAGFELCSLKMLILSVGQVEQFYLMHKEKEFYRGLVESMCSGPVVLMALSKENCVEDFRRLIGSTDPINAAEGTIRKKYGTSIRHNAIHGSDSLESAARELDFFHDVLAIKSY